MLNSVHCKNFRKHADLEVNFTAGINAIRAPNEKGKSALLESISYALFGAKGLKESVNDVVTYDVPVNQLWVRLVMTVAQVEYTITRSPKGAELTFGRETVTGQSEVTKFIERLLGANADMAGKLMLARQKSLGGALSGGPTAAGKMIEDLADLDLIEELVGLVGEKLPAGNTDATKGMIAALRTAAEPQDLPDLAPLQEINTLAVNRSEKAVKTYNAEKAKLDDLDLDAARQILTDEKVLRQAVITADTRIHEFEGLLAQPVTAAPAQEEIDALRQQVEQEKQLEAANKLHEQLKAAAIEDEWDQPIETLDAEIETTRAKVESLKAERDGLRTLAENLTTERVNLGNRYDMERTRIEAKLITETTCALCQKDLKDVPEVARINNPLSAQLETMEAEYVAAEKVVSGKRLEVAEAIPKVAESLAEAQAYLADLNAVFARGVKADMLYARAEQFIKVDRSTVPALWTWTGPTGEAKGLATQLRAMEAEATAAVREQQSRTMWTQQLAEAKAKLSEAQTGLTALQIKDAKETLELEVALKASTQRLLVAAQEAERALNTAKQEFEMARARRNQIMDDAEKAKANLAKVEASLAEMEANNLLVKKLRAARPAITDKLWSLVLASVSGYASEVRGERSAITRVDGEFRINGRPVTGLSGSAEDVLGLGIRFALTKTFLGNVDFVILDEAAAACDDAREVAMLGLLATSGFAQTILVTHSQLCESFADNIITF